MRHFLTLFFHEVRMLLVAPATYIATVLFLTLMALLFTLALWDVSGEASDQPAISLFFEIYWIPVFFIVPLLTMRSIAEERRMGTLETLMTTPVSAWQVVLAKFSAAYLFYLGMWALTLSFPLVTKMVVPSAQLTAPLATEASLAGGFAFIALSGLLYVSIGVFSSSLTRSQLVAGMLSFSLLFILIVSGRFLADYALPQNAPFTDAQILIDYLHGFKHLSDFGRGVLDSRPLFLYGSGTFLLLGLTALIVESKA